jgi:iron complex outermembrane receptor protein
LDASDVGNDGLPEISVTAQKRETNLQQTPISIAVLKSDDLANRHALSLEDLGDGSIPSLHVAPFFARNSALTIGMRGVGALGDANQPSRDQGVGVYVDGVYLGRAQGLAGALYDIDRIEVLKGPQGTLFGRNTEGGAISIVTKKPTGELQMDTTVGASNFDGYDAMTHINLPSFYDVSVKLDGLLEARHGTVTDPLAGQPDFDAYNRRGVHAEALWRPSALFSADYSVDVSNDKTTPYYVQLLTAGTLNLAPLIAVQPDRADRANVGVPLAWSVGKTYGHGLDLDWKVASHLEVKSITSYRHLTQTQFDNGEENNSVFTPNGTFSRYSLADFYQHQYSEELQLIGDVPQVSYVGGAFYYHENVRDDAWTPNTLRWNATGTDYTVLPVPIAATPFPDRASIAITSSTAVFGQATWTPVLLDEILHLTAGGRYTHDKKTGSLYLVNGATPTVNGVTAPLPLDKSWNRFDPLVTLSADVSHDISVYGRWSTGYKAGGANSRSLTYRAFNPESVSTFELGGKTEFLDHHARFNIAAYTGTYKDVQIDFSAIIPGANRGTVETTNASGTGRIKGVESDFALTPFNGLTLSASYAFAEIKLPEAPNPFVAGNPLVTVYPIYTPKHAGSVGIDYTPIAVTPKLTVHLDGNYTTRQYTMATDPTLSDNGFIVNGRLTLGEIPLNSVTGLQVSLWSRNLFDEAHPFLKNFNASLGRYGIFNEPRTFGIDGTVHF